MTDLNPDAPSSTKLFPCAKCGKAAPAQPKLTCFHLKPDGAPFTATWCSMKCKREDKGTHLVDCDKSKHRLQLWLAARVLKNVLTDLRYCLYDLPISVKKTDGRLVINWASCGANDIVWKYPGFRGLGLTQEDSSALLSYGACNMPTELFGDLVQEALEGCAEKIDELLILPRNERKIIDDQRPGHPDEMVHEVILVKLKDGGDYIVDIMGAQFDQHDTVLPLADYLKSNVKKIVQRRPLGHHKATQTARHGAAIGSTIFRALKTEHGNLDHRSLMVQQHMAAILCKYFKEKNFVREHIKIRPDEYAKAPKRWEAANKAILDLIVETIEDLGGYEGLYRNFLVV